MGRADLSAIAPDLIMVGEKWVFRHARSREMEAALSFTISGGVGAVPSDYVAIKHARIDGTPTRHLKVRDTRWIFENYPNRSATAKPSYIGVDAAEFVFGPFTDADYSVLGIYYKKLTPIASSANALFLANPDLYLFAALAEAEPYMKNDARIQIWMGKRDAIVRDIRDEMRAGQYDTAMEVRLG